MKFNWKSRKFIGAIATVIALYFGVPPVVTNIATDVVCEKIECEA